jgi:gustatory receptor
MGDGSFYIFAYYTMVVLRFWKRDQWCRLVQQIHNAATTETTYTNFVVVHVIFLSNMVYGIYLWSKILKSEFIKQFSIDMFLYYSKFLYNYLVYAVLKLILIRYKRLSEELLQFSHTTKHGRMKNLSSFLNRSRSILVGLKETSDILNDVLGWPILLMVFTAYQQILIYLDVVVNNPEKRDLNVILYDVVTILMLCVKFSMSNAFLYSTVDLQIGNVTIILLCDSIVRECEKILTASYRLADILQTRAAQDDQELLWKFTMMVKDNVPGFSAAGFFSLDKSIILKILNSLITMLIVMIQLKST